MAMRRAQATLLRSLLQHSLDRTAGTAAGAGPQAAVLHLEPRTRTSGQTANPRNVYIAAAEQQQTQRLRTIIGALAGGLAVFGYLQNADAHALAAEPQPTADAAAAESVNPTPDVYSLPTGLKGVPKEVLLYQYDVCPFCCKVKAVLDFLKIPYRCVEVGPLMKAELKWSPYKKVPVIVMDGDVLVDSSAIISRIAAESEAAAAAASPPAPQQKGWFGGSKAALPTESSAAASHTEEEVRWRRWVDERLVKVLTINIYRNRTESFQTFDYIVQQSNLNWLEREAGRVIGAAIMWTVSGRLKKKYNIEGEAREELYKTAAQWLDALGSREFLGGKQPNLADLSAFGAIRSITGTDTFMDLMHHTDIGGWYERMMAAVGDSSRMPS